MCSRTLSWAARTARRIQSAHTLTLVSSLPSSFSSSPRVVPPPRSMSSTPSASPASSALDLWNVSAYLLFAEMRSRPGEELLSRVESTLTRFHRSADAIRRVVDLGCGTGKLALALADRFKAAQVVGVDSSENMLMQAAAETKKCNDEKITSRVTWRKDLFQEFTDPEGVDLIYSNAALHWCYAQHSTLFPHLLSQLRPAGGILAVQMPNNFGEPSHLLMRRALEEGKFFSPAALDSLWDKQPNVDSLLSYYHLLSPHCVHIDAWHTEYLQRLESRTEFHPVLEWTKSTALAPILAALHTQQDKHAFQTIYSNLLSQAYPYLAQTEQGVKQAILPMKRIFLIAIRK